MMKSRAISSDCNDMGMVNSSLCNSPKNSIKNIYQVNNNNINNNNNNNNKYENRSITPPSNYNNNSNNNNYSNGVVNSKNVNRNLAMTMSPMMYGKEIPII